MIEISIKIALIVFLSVMFFMLLYEIIKPYSENIFNFLFLTKGKKEIVVFILDFLIGVGPNISSVSFVAIFIPIKGTSAFILLLVALFGIIMTGTAKAVRNKFF